MRLPLLALLILVALPGCTELRSYAAAGVAQRRTVNDLQARATMAATCDIALGAFFRELSPIERRYVGLVCGGMNPELAELPAAPAS
jgi:hypothetical protein